MSSQQRRALPLKFEEYTYASIEILFVIRCLPAAQQGFELLFSISLRDSCSRAIYSNALHWSAVLLRSPAQFALRDFRAFPIHRGGMFARNLRNPRTADPELDKKSLASLAMRLASSVLRVERAYREYCIVEIIASASTKRRNNAEITRPNPETVGDDVSVSIQRPSPTDNAWHAP
jgi:hypothetical protein